MSHSTARTDVRQEKIPTPKLLHRPREAAQLLGISEKSLWLLMKSGRLPVVKIGKSTRYDPADLRAFIEASKSTSA